MKSKVNQLKTRFREKLEADPTFSGTYRGRIMLMLESAIAEVFDKFKGDNE